MTTKSILLFFLFSFLHCHAENENSLVVKLSTESMLTPLYLASVSCEQSDFSKSYIDQLEGILRFDLDQNGVTRVVKQSSENDLVVHSGAFTQIGFPQYWMEQHIFYVVKPKIDQKTIQSVVCDVQKQMLKTIDPLNLTGNLAEDRKQIHRLADVIHKALFGKEGIASSRILYTVKTQTSLDSRKWISEVWEADYDGGNARQLTHENSLCVTPVYLPPKPGFLPGAFLYVTYRLGQPKIYMCSLKNGQKQRVAELRGNQFMPSISRQRDQIAFISDITGNPDLFVQPFVPERGAVKKAQQVFSAKQATQGSPSFNPEGNKLAFVSDKDGSPKVYVIPIPAPGANLNDIRPTLISKTNRENSAPSWSPDGKKIAYCSRSKGDRQIWIYDFETNQEMQITEGPGHKENPSWAPNSLHLVYNTSGQGKGALFITNIHGGNGVQISPITQDVCFPNWEPRYLNLDN